MWHVAEPARLLPLLLLFVILHFLLLLSVEMLVGGLMRDEDMSASQNGSVKELQLRRGW